MSCRNGVRLMLALGLSFLAIPAARAADPVYVQYHLWYAKDDVPLPRGADSYYWHGWSQVTPFAEVTDGVSPDNRISPWRRVTASRTGLPLTGPYSSIVTAAPAVSYGFRVAKQAGIDGMFASVFDGAWYPYFDAHLDLAAAAQMPLGLDLYHTGWGYNCTETAPKQIEHRVAILSQALSHTTHANYLKFNGKPVFWIANAPVCNANGKVFTWGNRAQLAEIISTTKTTTGRDFYLVITGPPTDGTEQFSTIPEVLRIIGAENISAYWGHFYPETYFVQHNATTDRTNFETFYQGLITYLRDNAPSKAALHVYPAFDERGLFPTLTERNSGQNTPRVVIGRDGNGMYAAADGFLKAALDKAASNQLWVFIESWNDWMEQTQIEPAFHSDQYRTHRDPFSALRQIAAYKGSSDVAFELPAATILDAPLRAQCRQKQWGSLTTMKRPNAEVHLRGKFGLASGAQLSNGIAVSLTLQKEPGGQWEYGGGVYKPYNGTLMPFDFNLTETVDYESIVLGIESADDPAYDWAYLTELVLDWYGQPINLLQEPILSNFSWHSGRPVTITWNDSDASHGPNGVARLSSVTMEDGNTYPSALYMVPNWDYRGFMHGVLNLPATGAPRRVLLTGRFGFATGATASNGAAMRIIYQEDDRNTATFQWPVYKQIDETYNGALQRFAIDITPILDKPAIAFSVDAGGNSSYDWIHFTELKLNWYGQVIDLIGGGAASQLSWFSTQGGVTWNDPNSANASKGVARVEPITMEDGIFYSSSLYLLPDSTSDGFIRAGLNPWITNSTVTPCN